MAIQIVCDNCAKVLKDKPDEVQKDDPKWQPDAHATLKLHIQRNDQNIRPIDMDLCIRCAKGYLAVLREPLP